MRVLVTGGTGFIGSHLIERLAAEGHEVYALVRDPARFKISQARTVHPLQADLLSLPDLPPGLDVVFHLAGLTRALKKAAYYSVNQEGTARLFTALRRLTPAPRTVLLSSLAAGGPSWEDRSRKECDPPTPITPYGESKLLGEREALVHKDAIPLVILRAGAVFGPRDQDFLGYFKLLQAGLMPVFSRKKRLMTLCYVEDLIRALLAAAERPIPSGEIFNVGDATPYTWEDIGEAGARVLGRAPKRILVPLLFAYFGAFITETASVIARRPSPVTRDKAKQYFQPGWVGDVSKAKEDLGFETRVPLDQGIRETVLWYQANGWL